MSTTFQRRRELADQIYLALLRERLRDPDATMPLEEVTPTYTKLALQLADKHIRGVHDDERTSA